MKKTLCAALAIVALVVATSTRADDSSAALAAGGIVFTKNTPVRMAQEDLYVSPKRIRIRFVFANDTDKDVETTVAFPLPDIDTATFWGSGLGTITNDPVNFIGFTAVVDGKPVPFHVEQRAYLKDRDVTAIVSSTGLPINPVADRGYTKFEKLPLATRKRLSDSGLALGDDNEFVPQWLVRTNFYWTQRFPAHRTVVIEHSYQPVTGSSFFTPENTTRKDKYDNVNYCFDAPTWTAIQAKSAASRKANPGNNGYLNVTWTDYILQTANNWNGPIGRFHLTLDKLKPDAVLSLCWDGKLKPTGPTTFEDTRPDFAPARDIRMLVLE